MFFFFYDNVYYYTHRLLVYNNVITPLRLSERRPMSGAAADARKLRLYKRSTHCIRDVCKYSVFTHNIYIMCSYFVILSTTNIYSPHLRPHQTTSMFPFSCKSYKYTLKITKQTPLHRSGVQILRWNKTMYFDSLDYYISPMWPNTFPIAVEFLKTECTTLSYVITHGREKQKG